jgi:hypothetical protein
MKALYDNLTLADLVNTASDEILTEELITMQLVNEGTVEQDYCEAPIEDMVRKFTTQDFAVCMQQRTEWDLESEEDWWDEVVDTFTNNPQMK